MLKKWVVSLEQGSYGGQVMPCSLPILDCILTRFLLNLNRLHLMLLSPVEILNCQLCQGMYLW